MELNYLDLYTSLVKANSLLPNPSSEIESKIEGFKTTVKNTPENPEFYVGEYYDGIAYGIYELAEKIQTYVDDLKQLSSKSSGLRGISKGEKMNVMLLGETSAGKTTFLERIYGENCGDTGPNPITAFAVTHKITDAAKSYLQMKFNQTFELNGDKSADDFKLFLKKYDFYRQFVIDKTKFNTNGEEFQLSEKDRFLNFINEANLYPNAFEEIVWHHKSSTRQIEFTKFANFIDMPGSGGMDEHTDNIQISMAKYAKNIDVVLYLIKSDQGVPSAYNFLKILKEQLDTNGAKPDFFFVYQIDNQDSFEDKLTTLRTFVNKDETTDAIEPFNAEEKAFYSNALVLDARGKKKEQKKANIALATVLQKFFIRRGTEFYDSLNLVNKPKEFDILEIGSDNPQKINGHLYDFLEDVANNCKGGNLPKIDDVKTRFKDRFCLKDKFDIPIFNDDLNATLFKIKTEINASIDSLFEFLATDSGGFLSSKPRYFDPTKYGIEFYEKYKAQSNWKSLMYNIQVLHWLRLSYNGNMLKDLYARTAQDSIQRTLLEYGVKLDNIKNEIPVVGKLAE